MPLIAGQRLGPYGVIPVSRGERLETLDVLRGFALLGILAMNIRSMAAPFGTYPYPYALFEYSGLNRAAYLFTSVVFDLKMMGLFSMLFGAGVLLYAAKPTSSGRPPRALWFRRMSVLLLIGLVHGYFIWAGDVLVPYALCGILILWWFRRMSASRLLAFAILFLAIGALLGLGHGLDWQTMTEAERAEEAAVMTPSRELAQQHLSQMLGSYTDFVTANAPLVVLFETLYFVAFFLWRCGGMMLLGMALFKWGFLDGRRSAGTYAWTAVVCTAGGLGLSWYGASELERVRYAMPARTVIDLWNYAGAVLASVGYAAAFLWVIKRGLFAGFRRRLAAVGQMALTNYLCQSVISSVVFLGWAFGFAGRLDYAGQLVFVAAIWALQLTLSPLWIAHFQFGPAEWLWRSLTYRARQPMQREASLTSV
jgi:uncharacterized protein